MIQVTFCVNGPSSAALELCLILTNFLFIRSTQRYLEHEHLLNCPTAQNSNNGLGSLPLTSVFYNDVVDPATTATGELPTKEKLSGAKTYENLMRFYTSLEISPAELRKKATKRLEELYNEVTT